MEGEIQQSTGGKKRYPLFFFRQNCWEKRTILARNQPRLYFSAALLFSLSLDPGLSLGTYTTASIEVATKGSRRKEEARCLEVENGLDGGEDETG